MHRTFEPMVARKVNAAATGNTVEQLQLLNAFMAGIPSTPAEECYECPGTSKAPNQDKYLNDLITKLLRHRFGIYEE
jgi:hypothetical protein